MRVPTDQAGGVAKALVEAAGKHARQPVSDTLLLMSVQIRNTLTDWKLPHD